MRILSLTSAAVVATMVASPAFAQMKTSSPKAAAPAAAPAGAGHGVASGDDTFRPTNTAGVNRAQVLADGNTVLGFSGLNVSMGAGNNMELGMSAPLTLSAGGAGFSLMTPAFTGKYLFMNAGNMSVAFAGNVALGLGSAGVTLTPSVGVPVSLWNLGPGDLHIEPNVTLPLTALNTMGFGVRAAYEFPLMAKWSLVISDSTGMNNTPAGLTTTNSLSLGARVGINPNMTAEVGGVSLTGSTVTLTAVNLMGYWGGRTADFHSAFGM